MKTVRVRGYLYDVQENGDEIALIPRTGGSPASSELNEGSYAYTHGGVVFVAAVDKAKKMAAQARQNN